MFSPSSFGPYMPPCSLNFENAQMPILHVFFGGYYSLDIEHRFSVIPVSGIVVLMIYLEYVYVVSFESVG